MFSTQVNCIGLTHTHPCTSACARRNNMSLSLAQPKRGGSKGDPEWVIDRFMAIYSLDTLKNGTPICFVPIMIDVLVQGRPGLLRSLFSSLPSSTYCWLHGTGVCSQTAGVRVKLVGKQAGLQPARTGNDKLLFCKTVYTHFCHRHRQYEYIWIHFHKL